MKSIRMQREILALTFTLAAGAVGCEGEASAPGPGGAADELPILDATQAADLAHAEQLGQVSNQGRVLAAAEGAALFDQIQQAIAAQREIRPQRTADGEELVAAKVPARDVTPLNVMLKSHSSTFTVADVWFNFPQWGGWIQTGCIGVPKPGAWKNLHFSVPNDVDVFFNGYKAGTTCAGGRSAPDLELVIHSPAKPTTANWWVQVF